MTRPIEVKMIATGRLWRHCRLWALTAAVGIAASAPFAPGALAQSAEGTWLTDPGPRQAKVEISACGRGTLCSKIVWLKQPNDSNGKPHRDVLNTDDALRGRPVLGMPILSDLQKSGDRAWQGNVYNPEDGKTYKAHFTLVGKDRAQLKGCAMFGMACREKYWTRAEPEKPKEAAVKPKPKPEPEPEPAPVAQPVPEAPPEPETPPAAAQNPDDIPAELWMDPAALEQEQGSTGPDPVEGPTLESSVEPAAPEAPQLESLAEPRVNADEGYGGQAAVEPQQVAPAKDAAPVPVPVQKPQIAKPKPKPKARAKPRRQAQPRKKEALPWLTN